MVSFIGKNPTLLVDLCIFTLALTVSDILTFKNFDFQKVGQSLVTPAVQYCNKTISRQMSKSIKDFHTFLHYLLSFQNFLYILD